MRWDSGRPASTAFSPRRTAVPAEFRPDLPPAPALLGRGPRARRRRIHPEQRRTGAAERHHGRV